MGAMGYSDKRADDDREVDVYTGMRTLRACEQQCADVDMDMDKNDMHIPDKGMGWGHWDNDVDLSKVPSPSCCWNIWPMGLRTLDIEVWAFDRLDMCDDFTLHHLVTPTSDMSVSF
jgi:hypothetical protein